ncbi:MAG: CoA pyrophosphatase [Bacteroidales bacterium]|nr:CoA pyrophosphatase [Bacteroidales bacterium]
MDSYDIFIENVRKNISREDKPGVVAQETMAPTYRKFMSVRQPIVDAAVLVLFYPLKNQPYIVLIKRTSQENSPHSGQISFPGGSYESHDTDYYHTALREAKEEIGIDTSLIHFLGSLTPLVIPVSGYRVFPYVAYVKQKPTWSINSHEVNYVIEVPFIEIFNSANIHAETIIYEEVAHQVPYFSLCGEKVWGATAMILAELKYLLI